MLHNIYKKGTYQQGNYSKWVCPYPSWNRCGCHFGSVQQDRMPLPGIGNRSCRIARHKALRTV